MSGSGKLKLVISLIIFLLPQVAFAQIVKITKVLDTNLFELKDGRVIKMAGLDIPRKNNPGVHLAELAEKIVEYSEKSLSGHEFEIIPVSESSVDTTFSYVYIIKHYPLSTVDMNKEFIKFGFGRFSDNVDSLHREEYVSAELRAVKEKRGLWAFRPYEVKDTLDKEHSPAEYQHFRESDSLSYKIFVSMHRPSAPARFFGATVIGAGTGALSMIPFSLLGGAVGYSLGPGHDGWSGAIGGLIGAYVGFVVGSSTGVYFTAKSYYSEVSYIGTLASGILGSAAGIGIAALSSKGGSDIFWAAPFIFPLIGSVTYVMAADNSYNYESRQENSLRQEFSTYGNNSFKDYRNKEILYKIRLITIEF
ncbi:MAG: thermonuclease family protein [Bacillota bacterium]